MAPKSPLGIAAMIRRAEAAVARERAPRRVSGAFLAKGLALSALLAGGIVLLADRYSIAIAPQASLCLPPHRIWIIDKHDATPIRGEIFAFKSAGLAPLFADGTTIVKVLDGMPGDEVKVDLEVTTVNGRPLAQGLDVAAEHGVDPQRYVRAGRIEEGRYWFFGRTRDSFDSRYWGSVGQEQILGRAYPLW